MKHTMQRGRESGLAHLGIAIALVAVLAAVAFGGWYVWQRNEKDSQEPSANANQTQDQTITEDKKSEQKITVPEGWLFYKNDEAGFSFYYPPEWGEVKKLQTAYKFSNLASPIFDFHERTLKGSSMEFGNIEPIVRDVFIEDGKPVVQLAQGFNKVRDFASDQIIKTLDAGKACVTEDYFWKDYTSDPESVNGYIYFGYCGLVNERFGAFTFSSGSLDITDPKTQKLKEDITKLLRTFQIF